MLISWVDK